MVKDFEIESAKYENEFDSLSLKTYYFRPEVEKEKGKYDLEDYNFEAYIPTLLPLLIGRNLYKQEEVFIRELIQNAIDAILLRKNVLELSDAAFDYDGKITIEVGVEDPEQRFSSDLKENVPFIRVIDNGVGMDQQHMERYFFHIGRSFYDSREYSELLDKKQTSYRPISKFGIGFLSCFMVCNRIRVQTRSHIAGNEGLDIYIPNHKGCFFIKKDRSLPQGATIVTLFEDSDKKFDVSSFSKYIDTVLLDLPVEVNLTSTLPGNQFSRRIPPLHKRAELRNSAIENVTPFFFVPFTDRGEIDESVADDDNLESLYGIAIVFHSVSVAFSRRPSHRFEPELESEGKIVEMNSGVLLGEGSEPSMRIIEPLFCDIWINYPPAIVELDVSREKITRFRDVPKWNTYLPFSDQLNRIRIVRYLGARIESWMKGLAKTSPDIKLIYLHMVCDFWERQKLSGKKSIGEMRPCLVVHVDKRTLLFRFVRKSDLKDVARDSNCIAAVASPFRVDGYLVRGLDRLFGLVSDRVPGDVLKALDEDATAKLRRLWSSREHQFRAAFTDEMLFHGIKVFSNQWDRQAANSPKTFSVDFLLDSLKDSLKNERRLHWRTRGAVIHDSIGIERDPECQGRVAEFLDVILVQLTMTLQLVCTVLFASCSIRDGMDTVFECHLDHLFPQRH